MRLLCLSCDAIFRTRRKDIEKVKCPYCGAMITNVYTAKLNYYLIMDDKKIRF
jgi:predicted RNA-binding Zn-ribbon protein involved in translation (DUF1610 family)